jgi:hypothetical protein
MTEASLVKWSVPFCQLHCNDQNQAEPSRKYTKPCMPYAEPSSTLLLFPPRIAHKPSSTCEHIQNHVCHMQKCLNEFPPRIEDKWNSMTLISVHINFKYWQHKKTEIHVVNLVGRPEKTRHSDAVSSGRDSFRFRLKTHSGFGWWPIEHYSVTQTIVCSSLIHYKNMIYLDTTPFK